MLVSDCVVRLSCCENISETQTHQNWCGIDHHNNYCDDWIDDDHRRCQLLIRVYPNRPMQMSAQINAVIIYQNDNEKKEKRSGNRSRETETWKYE